MKRSGAGQSFCAPWSRMPIWCWHTATKNCSTIGFVTVVAIDRFIDFFQICRFPTTLVASPFGRAPASPPSTKVSPFGRRRRRKKKLKMRTPRRRCPRRISPDWPAMIGSRNDPYLRYHLRNPKFLFRRRLGEFSFTMRDKFACQVRTTSPMKNVGFPIPKSHGIF
jgi:hypothetical protein